MQKFLGQIYMLAYFGSKLQENRGFSGNSLDSVSTSSKNDWKLWITRGRVDSLSISNEKSDHSASTIKGCSGSAIFSANNNHLLGFHTGIPE